MASAKQGIPPELTLIFDGHCGVCTRVAQIVHRHDRHSRIHLAAAQLAGVREQYGLTKLQTDEAAWAIDAQGRRYRGAAAIVAVLGALFQIREVLLTVYGLPGIREVMDAGYRWVAANRRHLPGVTPFCATNECVD